MHSFFPAQTGVLDPVGLHKEELTRDVPFALNGSLSLLPSATQNTLARPL